MPDRWWRFERMVWLGKTTIAVTNQHSARLSITVLAARKGNVFARYNLGIREMKCIWRGILNTSWFQWDLEMMALKLITNVFMKGHATKDDYAKALWAHAPRISINEIKSVDWDKAAAISNRFKYYEWYMPIIYQKLGCKGGKWNFSYPTFSKR